MKQKHIFPPQTRQSAYILGFYAADGHMKSKHKYSIAQRERGILERIKEYLESEDVPSCIYDRPNETLSELTIGNVKRKNGAPFWISGIPYRSLKNFEV